MIVDIYLKYHNIFYLKSVHLDLLVLEFVKIFESPVVSKSFEHVSVVLSLRDSQFCITQRKDSKNVSTIESELLKFWLLPLLVLLIIRRNYGFEIDLLLSQSCCAGKHRINQPKQQAKQKTQIKSKYKRRLANWMPETLRTKRTKSIKTFYILIVFLNKIKGVVLMKWSKLIKNDQNVML